ncbi:hypothetical protein D3C80_1750480 [compost metagenome]
MNFTKIDIRNVRTHFIQEVAVMGYNNNCSFIVHEEVLQPLNRLQIQVVGRFVKEQVIRAAEQSLSQENTYLLIAAEL